MATAVGHARHLWIKKETTWGTAVTPDVWVPFTSYNVKPNPEYYQGTNAFVGVRQRKAPVQVTKIPIGGTLAGDCYGYQVSSKSILQHMLDMAVSAPAAVDLDSFTAEIYDANDSRRHAGCRFGSFTISGSEDSQNLTYSAEIQAKTEDGGVTPPTLVQATPQGDAFLFKDVTFSIGGSAVDIFMFELGVQNSLIVKHNNTSAPSLIKAGDRNITLKIGIYRSANTYSAINRAVARADYVGSLALKGAHGGSGANTYSVATIAIDRMNIQQIAEEFSRTDLDKDNLDFAIIKPNSADNDIDITWSTSA